MITGVYMDYRGSGRESENNYIITGYIWTRGVMDKKIETTTCFTGYVWTIGSWKRK